jgi:hypothetical protein
MLASSRAAAAQPVLKSGAASLERLRDAQIRGDRCRERSAKRMPASKRLELSRCVERGGDGGGGCLLHLSIATSICSHVYLQQHLQATENYNLELHDAAAYDAGCFVAADVRRM